jgi:hypothetical protein
MLRAARGEMHKIGFDYQKIELIDFVYISNVLILSSCTDSSAGKYSFHTLNLQKWKKN